VPEVSDKNTLNLILKGDVSGSLEVLSEVVRSLPDAVHINLHVISESVGDISDGDVKAAAPFKALILGFNVKLTKAAEVLAKAQNVLVVRSEILYELIQAFQREIARIRGIIIRGDLEILALFGKKGGQQVIGGKVVAGEILNNAMLKVQRLQKDLGEARVINLQEARRDVQTVLAGKECGLLVTSEVEIKVGDHLILI
jgi:translation initiation factor IF-2